MEAASEGNKHVEEMREMKREIPANLQKICLVCGDKALGYNFNAISCESCKAFFRRNALASKEFKCPFTNNCKITAVTRRFCQKCRLEKCFAIGMVKEFIMSEQDKAEKRRKIEENKAKKRQNFEPDDCVSSSKAVKRDEHPGYYTQDQSIIQYDVLNSTTCSPNSSIVQSPLSEVDTSTHSTSAYPVYAPIQGSGYPYTMKVYPIDEKAVMSKEVYEQRVLQPLEPYNSVCDSMSSSIFDPPKQNSIRSILTQDAEATSFKDIEPVVENPEPEHVCAELPSTSSANPDVNKAKLILQDVERIEPNSMESILCEAIKLEFESYSPVANCSGSSRGLNEVERAKLNELIVANKAHHAPIDDDVSQLIGDATAFKDGDGKHDPRLIMVVNLTAVAIRRFIKMAKKIGAFRNMCEEDQVALLKGGVIELMILRSTMNYDGQKNQWKLPHSQENGPFGSIRTDLLKLAKGNIYRSHEDFINSFDPRWRTDENVILIMSAILLFTPDRPKVVHKDVVKLEQNSYYYLLRRYLESVYPGCEAKSTFLKLIQKILELRKITEEVTSVYLDVNPLEPLLMEIFDLKHHAA